ncbi:von Willebrand factor type A domain-containing protein [Devosia aurantiaca]|uniref:von Willebrand factor type A domain-containing protein n=1 Tax=Devosia aurantiaca TaxID=2714858 RepID=UPI002E2CC692|nr:von Willebrand factor type A domain-containing protein [Devosia aurantiaca]
MSFPEDHDPFTDLRGAPQVPSEDARQRALTAGQVAFEAAQKSAETAKERGFGARLKSIITSLKRISIMEMRVPVATAAVALLLLPVGWQFYHSTALTPVGGAGQQLAVPEAELPAIAQQSTTASEPIAEPMAEAEAATNSAADSLASEAPPMPVAPAPALAQRAPAMEQFAAPMPAVPSVTAKESGAYMPPAQATEPSGDNFKRFDEQRLKIAAEEPVSTFSIDVDTASYSYMRRMLEDGFVPEPDAVRIEELINYFPYDYPAAASADAPFRPTVSVFPTPWNKKTQILQIGIKGFEPPVADTRSNLVFLIDTSGSMDEPDKLPLLKRAFALLLDQLGMTIRCRSSPMPVPRA